MQFSELELSPSIVRGVEDEGYHTATPIQAQTIPYTLAGRDVLGCAQTGTGKTAAFALPILHRLASKRPKGMGKHRGPQPRPIRCLVLSPTRELALQIGESFDTYGKHLPLRQTTIFGGVNQSRQVQALKAGVDVLIATPGRLLDLIDQGYVRLNSVQTLILDEADRMLDMGFIHDMRKVVKLVPRERQTLLFSATMPKAIRDLAKAFLRDPAEVHVAPQSTAADRVEQSVYFVHKKHKPELLAHLLDTQPVERAIVFTRTKHGADKVVRKLHQAGVESAAIHGNKSQNNRNRTLERFKSGAIHVLIATDVASRGIDIDGVSHVINFDLPHEPESYVHRIGRTARAGAAGTAIAFCDEDERPLLRDIERVLGDKVAVRDDHPAYRAVATAPAVQPRSARGGRVTADAGGGSGQGDGSRSKKPRRGRGGGAPNPGAGGGSGAANKRRRPKRKKAAGKSGAPGQGVVRRGRGS